MKEKIKHAKKIKKLKSKPIIIEKLLRKNIPTGDHDEPSKDFWSQLNF